MSGVDGMSPDHRRAVVVRILVEGGWTEEDAYKAVRESERQTVLATIDRVRSEGRVKTQSEGIPTLPLNRAEWEAQHGDLEKSSLLVEVAERRVKKMAGGAAKAAAKEKRYAEIRKVHAKVIQEHGRKYHIENTRDAIRELCGEEDCKHPDKCWHSKRSDSTIKRAVASPNPVPPLPQ